jgi:hypothetical protein
MHFPERRDILDDMLEHVIAQHQVERGSAKFAPRTRPRRIVGARPAPNEVAEELPVPLDRGPGPGRAELHCELVADIPGVIFLDPARDVGCARRRHGSFIGSHVARFVAGRYSPPRHWERGRDIE